MRELKRYRGFSRKGIFFVCLLSLLLFASNAFADLYYYNLLYASPELNGGKMGNYGAVTVNLTSQDHATITFKSFSTYTLQDQLAVQVNAWVYDVNDKKPLPAGVTFSRFDEYNGFGYFNASFNGLSESTSYSFNLTRKKGYYDFAHWNSAKDVLVINDWGYLAVSQMESQTGNSGYAAAKASRLGRDVTGSAVVPIPGAVWLLGSGLVGLAAIRRRRAA